MGRWGDGNPPLAPPRRGMWGDGGMGRWGPTPRPSPSQEGNIEKYLVMVEDGTFLYAELNGFDIISCSDN
ncbi:hypothetical protein [Okeania sp. SIO1I7]|uniref:hypothetical protein n=1 Tax=Okeania sp. SIO1I7 TaxID=2607772 RepID=UPI0013F8F21A|nr:hypothetical protein [Okeania sp. SIO1I7]NET27484.1 hypothetical protein [Okeania sp. SIO1I7]